MATINDDRTAAKGIGEDDHGKEFLRNKELITSWFVKVGDKLAPIAGSPVSIRVLDALKPMREKTVEAQEHFDAGETFTAAKKTRQVAERIQGLNEQVLDALEKMRAAEDKKVFWRDMVEAFVPIVGVPSKLGRVGAKAAEGVSESVSDTVSGIGEGIGDAARSVGAGLKIGAIIAPVLVVLAVVGLIIFLR